MLTGKRIWEAADAPKLVAIFNTKVANGWRPPLSDIPPEVPPSVRDCISQGWVMEQEKRPTFSVITKVFSAATAAFYAMTSR